MCSVLLLERLGDFPEHFAGQLARVTDACLKLVIAEREAIADFIEGVC